MKVNQWLGRKFSTRIELNLRDKFGDEWLLNNPPANFEVLQSYVQRLKFDCAQIEYDILNKLRLFGLPVHHQVIYFNRYIVDIALVEAKVILELDGPYHHLEKQKMKDSIRDEVFNEFGFTVHRWNIPLNAKDLERKLDSFVKAYKRFCFDKPLKPILRPVAVEKMMTNGCIQKALDLKPRAIYARRYER